MSENDTLKSIIRDLTSVSGGQVFTAYREDVPVNHQEAILKIWADPEVGKGESDCGCGLGGKCPDPPVRKPLNESVAESLIYELFAGKIQVALAGNPVTCQRLENRIRDFFDWQNQDPHIPEYQFIDEDKWDDGNARDL